MNKSVINSYRLQPGPVQSPPSPGVIAGRIIPAVTSANYRRALVVLAVVLLPLLAVGVVIYAAQATRSAPVAVQAVPSVSVAAPVVVVQERVVEVTAPPVVVIVTATPAPVKVERPAPAPVAPRVPAVSQPAPQPTARPRIQPTAPPPPSPAVGGPVRAAAPVAQQTPDAGPQQKLFNRPCEYQRAQYPQGTVIKGYYTDANGIKQDAICRADGWKAVD